MSLKAIEVTFFSNFCTFYSTYVNIWRKGNRWVFFFYIHSWQFEYYLSLPLLTMLSLCCRYDNITYNNICIPIRNGIQSTSWINSLVLLFWLSVSPPHSHRRRPTALLRQFESVDKTHLHSILCVVELKKHKFSYAGVERTTTNTTQSTASTRQSNMLSLNNKIVQFVAFTSSRISIIAYYSTVRLYCGCLLFTIRISSAAIEGNETKKKTQDEKWIILFNSNTRIPVRQSVDFELWSKIDTK